MNLFFASDPLEPQDTDPEKKGEKPYSKTILPVCHCMCISAASATRQYKRRIKFQMRQCHLTKCICRVNAVFVVTRVAIQLQIF